MESCIKRLAQSSRILAIRMVGHAIHDLALLVSAEDERLIQLQSNHIRQLLDELGIAAEFEGPGLMRLEDDGIRFDVMHFPPVQPGRVELNATVRISSAAFPSSWKENSGNVNCEDFRYADVK